MRPIHTVLLVNAGTDEQVSSIANDGTFPALGVVSLATMLRELVPEIDVTAVDGQVTPLADVLRLVDELGPDLVGVSALSTSYRTSIALLEHAKEAGAVTVLGNDQAAAKAEQILRHQPAVDFVCAADVGEFALAALVRALRSGGDLAGVPRLWWREDGRIRRTGGAEIPETLQLGRGGAVQRRVLDAISVPDRSLMPQANWDAYLANYLDRYGRLHGEGEVTGVTTINRARGCARVRNPCHFCGIADLSLRFSSAEMFWRDVRQAQEQVGATIFYEAFDSMSSAPRWLEELADARPDDIGDPRLFVYTQASETTPRLVELYRRIGVYRVNMGLESGDTRMLKLLKGRRDSLESNQRAATLLQEAGMPIYGSLVLGGPGETVESLERTIDFARWLVDHDMMAALEAQPLYPEFTALTGTWLMDPAEAHRAAERMGFEVRDPDLLAQMPQKYGPVDLVDFDEASRDWNTIFSVATWDEVVAATEEIRAYAHAHGTAYGSAFVSTHEVGAVVDDARPAD